MLKAYVDVSRAQEWLKKCDEAIKNAMLQTAASRCVVLNWKKSSARWRDENAVNNVHHAVGSDYIGLLDHAVFHRDEVACF